jgi:hypothetical protein
MVQISIAISCPKPENRHFFSPDFLLFFYFVGGTRYWTQGLALARQVQSASPFFRLVIFVIGSGFMPRLAWIMILLFVSFPPPLARMTGAPPLSPAIGWYRVFRIFGQADLKPWSSARRPLCPALWFPFIGNWFCSTGFCLLFGFLMD